MLKIYIIKYDHTYIRICIVYAYFRCLTDSPDKTMVKKPLSLMNLSERSETYLAKDTARYSLLTTSKFLLSNDAFTDTPILVLLGFMTIGETPLHLREWQRDLRPNWGDNNDAVGDGGCGFGL